MPLERLMGKVIEQNALFCLVLLSKSFPELAPE
jgi:hypothetical protein